MADPQVAVWVLRPDDVQSLGASFTDALSDAERARAARFHVPADALAFTAAHALLRHALSLRWPQVAPRAWTFSTGPHGKPRANEAPGDCNLSHCRALVAVAVSGGPAVGVDVEAHRPALATDDVAAGAFGPRELADLRAQPDEAARLDRFFARWTVKEAYLKATGVGLHDALPDEEFDLASGQARRLRGLTPGAWPAWWWKPEPDATLAVCVAGAEGPPRWAWWPGLG